MGVTATANSIGAQFATAWAMPFPFLAAIVPVGLAIWWFVNREYAVRLKNADSRRELAEAQVADYQRKLAGASPEEAKARIDGLESRVEALMPRRVTALQREAISAALAGRSGFISIGTDMACADAPAISAGLTAAFRNAGWQVQNPSFMGLANPPLSGMSVRCVDPHRPTPQEARVIAALQSAGLAFDIQPGADAHHPYDARPQPEAQIVITPKVLD